MIDVADRKTRFKFQYDNTLSQVLNLQFHYLHLNLNSNMIIL